MPRPGDHHIPRPRPSAGDEDGGVDKGGATLLADSIKSISVGNRHSKYQLVDFTLTHKVLSNPPAGMVYPPQPRDQFDSSQSLEYVGILVLCELKHGRMYDIDILGLLNNPFRFTAPHTLNLSISLKYARQYCRKVRVSVTRQVTIVLGSTCRKVRV